MSETPNIKDLPAPPPATFSNIVEMLASQSLAAMGKLPQSGAGMRLDYAKYFIDLLEVLKEKTSSRLNPDETNIIDGTLHYLRMMYVEENKSK